MKKFMIFALAALLMVAFTAPAMAKYTVGAKMLTTIGWKGDSKERTTSGKDITTFWNSIEGHSRLFVSFVNAAKDTGGHVEMGYSSYTSAGISLRHIYGWYKVGKCKFLAGHTDNWSGTLAFAPSQNVSVTPHLKLLFIDWGTQWAVRRPQLSFTYMSGGFGFQIGVAQPLKSVSGWTGGDAYNTLPEIWVAVQFRAGGFAMIPNFSWTRYEYEGLSNGVDDSVDGWFFILPLKFNVGPVSIRFAAHYIYNKGLTPLANWADGANANPVLSGTTFKETTQVGGNLAIHYYAGAFKLYAGVGMEKLENDTWAKKDYTRIAYFIACRYQVTKNFFINPEFGYYDYGDDETTGADAGNEWVLGALFAFSF